MHLTSLALTACLLAAPTRAPDRVTPPDAAPAVVERKATLVLEKTEENGTESGTYHYRLTRPGGSQRTFESEEPLELAKGRYVAFDSTEGGQGGLRIYDAETDTFSTKLTVFPETEIGPFKWSPEGSSVAFTTANQTQYRYKAMLFI